MSEQGETPIWTYTFRLTRDDWARVERIRAPQGLLKYAFVGCAIVLGLVWAILLDQPAFGREAPLWRQVAVFAFLAALALGLYIVLANKEEQQRVDKHPPADPETCVEIFGSYLCVTTQGLPPRSYAWENFFQVLPGPGFVQLIYTADEVIIIPERAFGDADTMAAFVLDARGWIEGLDEASLTDEEQDAYAETWKDLAPNRTFPVQFAPYDSAAIARDLTPGKILSLPTSALLATLFGSVIGGGVGALLNMLMDEVPFTFWLWASFAWPGAVLAVWFAAKHYESRANAPLQLDDARLEPRHFTMDESGIRWSAPDFETRFQWAAIADIKPTNDYILFISRYGDTIAIPRRCFVSRAPKSDSFIADAEQLKAQSKKA